MAQRASSEASNTIMGRKTAKGWTQNSKQNSELAGHSRAELVFSRIFEELGVPLARHPLPPALECSV